MSQENVESTSPNQTVLQAEFNDNNSDNQEQAKQKANFGSFLKSNWFTMLVLIYLISPIDLIPEAIFPVIGHADDAFIGLLEVIRRYYLFKKKKAA